MKKITALLLVMFIDILLANDVMSQYVVVPAYEDSLGWTHWELRKIMPRMDTVRISLDDCQKDLDRQAAFLVVGDTLYGCNFKVLVQEPTLGGPWYLKFAVYAIEGKALRLIEAYSYRIRDFSTEAYRRDFRVNSESTRFVLAYYPFSKYGGAVMFNCAFYEPGDAKRLHKRFIRMVRQFSRVKPPTKGVSALDQI